MNAPLHKELPAALLDDGYAVYASIATVQAIKAQGGFPKAQMMVCGVLGPRGNARGANEFLHVPYARKLTAAVARVLTSLS
jgi:hypothetical protein